MSSTQPEAFFSTALGALGAVVAAVFVLAGPHGSVEIALASDEAIAIAQGVSVTPAPGWTLGNRGPNWVALNNADTSAQMRITVKHAGGTDAAAVLQGDIDQYVSGASAILAGVNRLTAPDVTPLQGPNFQQQASVNYTANVVNPQGTIPVIGTFTELLNTSNGRSAFIDFRQGGSATTQAAGDGGMMVGSME
ncbi:hypothetical protein OEM_33760 [Mycobacterium intracellulare subsp. yongonense 05-1390]|uniref:hypothetical protein n=1 Tax=Mycobacterium TaxID=1763 RepID=UPI0003556A1F|nr:MULTISPECIES: hypothetical protein [Mycobacterium]AGP64911.1 hypothetical protein OEM_33760 [Mycobacterium intracellulare subsp. yongonense 05-1390]ARR78988.1 hypothetical protein MOTT12_03324 [Mycobacterium intracellulare subsp. yongonense]ARR84058.1 hypothetical protein MOTT27_03237 [Mycobacterium intracellulare subsp. yongonense]KEF95156.1 hypothetical protein K883_05112 [Mycobacterium sp. TKK-01-0059]OCB20598.1 hypothetical protein A5644_02115 [Mycobacterium intracellulare subsp. yongon